MIRVLFIGDVVGENSCEALGRSLPGIKHELGIDLTIANGENSADGNGITPFSARLLMEAGVDVITGGNHSYKRREMEQFYHETELVLRPANGGSIGRGMALLDRGRYSVAVVNLIGTAYMAPADNPFHKIEALLGEIHTKNIIVDFHAEATAEKKAMAYFLAGRVSAVFGTHTHVQTADEEILAGHTAYITDVGMTGVTASVLGIESSVIVSRFYDYYPQRHVYAEGEVYMNAVVAELDPATGRAVSVVRVNRKLHP